MSDCISKIGKAAEKKNQLFPYIVPIKGSRAFRTAVKLAGLEESVDYSIEKIIGMDDAAFKANRLDQSGFTKSQLALCELWWLPLTKQDFQEAWEGAKNDSKVREAINTENQKTALDAGCDGIAATPYD